jgi:hypothetical protein
LQCSPLWTIVTCMKAKRKNDFVTIGIPLTTAERKRIADYCARGMKKGAFVREAILAYLDAKDGEKTA